MSSAVGAVVALLVLLSLGAGPLLYWFVRAERADRDVMSRADAERAARRDTEDDE